MTKDLDPAADFLDALSNRKQAGSSCWICGHPEMAQLVADCMDACIEAGRKMPATALGEWLRAKHGYPLQPRSVVHHLTSHESDRWRLVRA